jgi:hypothetical protein
VAYTYSTLLTALAAALATPATDADLLSLYPTIIDDAEQTCYRDLGLLVCRVSNTGLIQTNTRFYTLPTNAGKFLVIDQVNIFDLANKRHPLVPVSREFVDFVWPSEAAPTATAMPTIFARIDDGTLLFGPAAGYTWPLEVIGTIRPTPLSMSNTTTFLTTYLSDLFFAACMVSATGNLLKSWSAVADDPQMGISWKTIFDQRLLSAQREELRKTYVSQMSPASNIRSA